MNPLSILNTASRASGLKDSDSFVSRDDATQDDHATQGSSFARMLDNPGQAQTQASTRRARSDASGRDNAKPLQDEEGTRHDDASRAKARDDQPAHADRADRAQRKASAQGAEAGTAETEESAQAGAEAGQAKDTATDDAGAWPPPGLGGFGMMLLQPGATPAPVATADTATLAGGAASQLLPGLPQADANATMSSATPQATGAIALPGLATPATSAASTGADGDAAALTALAAAAIASAGKNTDAASADGATPAIDSPTFVLPTLPHTTGTTRVQDSASVFTGTPTPTPDLNSDGFDDAVGTRLTWLAEQKIGHAHIKITPNDLGPVEVRLQMDGDKVHASFTATHVETRQALEQSLPRLRDMLGEHGFQLAHADVGAQQQGQRNDGNASESGFAGRGEAAGEEATSVVVPAAVLRARGLLDAYA